VERLVFGHGTTRHQSDAPEAAAGTAPRGPAETGSNRAGTAERRDWAFIGLMVFTGLLFFRPQDMIRPLRMLHLAEMAALVALGSLVAQRLGRGKTVSRLTPELVGVLGLAAVILLMAPFAVWMGGAIATFTDLYAKVVLIFVLMVNTLTSPKRMEQFTWLIVIASGYIAGRAVIDYVRGVNLIEYGRVQGSVGGMFKNPNDLALNMVAVLPLAAFLFLQPFSAGKRAIAALAAVLMAGAVIASQSRSGTVGLAAMGLVLSVHMVKRKPGMMVALVFAALFALPMLPSSYWQRIASITDKNLDQTGSREARSILLQEAFDAFRTHPFTGVGAGQFVNYNPEGRQEAWREAHNVVLQVAAELGVVGLAVFAYLVGRAFYAPIQTQRLLRAATRPPRGARESPVVEPLSPHEHQMLTTFAAALLAAVTGWFVCALFASVAYHWTFYYLLALAAAPRDYLQARMAGARSVRRAPASRPAAALGVHA